MYDTAIPMIIITPVSCPNAKCFDSIYAPTKMKVIRIARKITYITVLVWSS